MKIVVLDGYTENPGDLSYDALAALGDLTVYDDTKPEDMISHIGDADIAICNKVYMTREIIEACPNLKFITLFATGYNKIDLDACREHGIVVSNAPKYGTYGVAQHTMGLLLELTQRCGAHDEAVKRGQWAESESWCFYNYPIIDLYGKTVGVIGMGMIGNAFANMVLPFGAEVLYYNPHRKPELENDHIHYAELSEIYEKCDIISMHCPLFPENTKMINEESIGKMKDGVIFLNTARGGLVDEDAMLKALKSGKVYAAGLDVVATEPMPAGHPFMELDNVILTPHMAWASKGCRQKVMDIVCDNIKAFQKGNPQNVVS